MDSPKYPFQTVAVLFARQDSVYKQLPGTDVWDIDRDARKWPGGAARMELVKTDPFFYDPQVAGWWVWGLCSWIGSGWCAQRRNGDQPEQIPHLGNAGMGINRSKSRTSATPEWGSTVNCHTLGMPVAASTVNARI